MKDECVKCKKTAIQLDDADKLYWYCTHTYQEETYGVDEGKEFLLCEMCFPIFNVSIRRTNEHYTIKEEE